ncbi:hypothetical protein V6N12_000146 [Hibiscus sabdariffa]|uniref:Uncharacterized protein n=1 Tax=Hibiscus sabdariffa TaxID=183260 RepID=A0ABR2B2P7_9ROSI
MRASLVNVNQSRGGATINSGGGGASAGAVDGSISRRRHGGQGMSLTSGPPSWDEYEMKRSTRCGKKIRGS